MAPPEDFSDEENVVNEEMAPKDSMGNDRPESESEESEDDEPQALRPSLKSAPAPAAAAKPYIAGQSDSPR